MVKSRGATPKFRVIMVKIRVVTLKFRIIMVKFRVVTLKNRVVRVKTGLHPCTGWKILPALLTVTVR
jgi:hypothetical protein